MLILDDGLILCYVISKHHGKYRNVFEILEGIFKHFEII